MGCYPVSASPTPSVVCAAGDDTRCVRYRHFCEANYGVRTAAPRTVVQHICIFTRSICHVKFLERFDPSRVYISWIFESVSRSHENSLPDSGVTSTGAQRVDICRRFLTCLTPPHAHAHAHAHTHTNFAVFTKRLWFCLCAYLDSRVRDHNAGGECDVNATRPRRWQDSERAQISNGRFHGRGHFLVAGTTNDAAAKSLLDCQDRERKLAGGREEGGVHVMKVLHVVDLASLLCRDRVVRGDFESSKRSGRGYSILVRRKYCARAVPTLPPISSPSCDERVQHGDGDMCPTHWVVRWLGGVILDDNTNGVREKIGTIRTSPWPRTRKGWAQQFQRSVFGHE